MRNQWKNKENREKAEELVKEMTTEEAASQLLFNAPAIERLGVSEYNYWNEGLHGVARAGCATVFPQAIGLAAMFDQALLKEVADVISTEARAKYNGTSKSGDHDIYKGLTLWSPNVNIFRDPRWGRGQETYGEDPFLTKKLGAAFIEGLQGDGKYLKTAACAKHFAVHSGPEALRHEFDAKVSQKDLHETYLPAFKAAVEHGVEIVMGAYNAVNGEPSCANHYLISDLLRGEWNFDGHVVSDCWAVRDFHEGHHFTKRPEESATTAVKEGCDLNCGCTYEHLLKGLEEGLIEEKDIRKSAVRVMQTRARLGMFADDCEYDDLPFTDNCKKEHTHLAYKTAVESMVLLKNDGLLPLDAQKIKTIGVIGPQAASIRALYGNYNGDSMNWITALKGIVDEAGDRDIRVLYSEGCHLWMEQEDGLARPGKYYSEALAVADNSDVVVLCVGLDGRLEGEQGDTGNADASGDKADLLLPKTQRRLCELVAKAGKPVILAVNAGSAIDFCSKMPEVNAALMCWYGGEQGGKALADVIFGKAAPGGRLPVTFYRNDTDFPDFTDYSMRNRTYRYFKGEVLYPFGYGLSYGKTSFSDMSLEKEEDGLKVGVTVEFIGNIPQSQSVQIYARKCDWTEDDPMIWLCGFTKLYLKSGEKAKVQIKIPYEELQLFDRDGRKKALSGRYEIFAGDSLPSDVTKVQDGHTKQKMPLVF